MSIRVLVVDDQRVVRAGLCALLAADPGIDVVGEAEDGVEAIELARELDPEVVLMDVRMPRMDGLAATARLRGPGTDAARPRVVMLTTFDLDEYVYEALRAGASGFLLKDASEEELVAAVRVVAAGDALLAPSVTRRVIADLARRPPARPPPDALSDLTPREAEVWSLVARGLSNAEIADRLVVAEQTVKTHVSRVLAKLGLRDRVQLVVLAYETALVVPGGP